MPVHCQAQQIAPHVAYEVESFFKAIQGLETTGAGDATEMNQRIETALMHARVVYEFLFVPARPNCPDVSARDFFDHPSQWTAERKALCPYLTERKERLNRSVPHLSYDRLKYEQDEEWDLRKVATEIADGWESFLNQLPDERRSWFAPRAGSLTASYRPAANLCARTDSSVTDVRILRLT